MPNALLKEISVENFKSHKEETRVELSPLTVLVGPNNGGKSTIVQALLLLQQTLDFPRVEVPLHLSGAVEANSLRELTHGWPAGDDFEGPRFRIRWSSEIQTSSVLDDIGESSLAVAVERVGSGWLESFGLAPLFDTDTSIDLRYAQQDGKLVLRCIELLSFGHNGTEPRLQLEFFRADDGTFLFACNGEAGKSVEVNLDHFIPYISINTRNIGPRDRQRAWVNAFKAVFLQPLDDLRAVLGKLNYLSSARDIQPAIYRSSSAAPDGVGVSGELAAQLLQASRDKSVLYLSPGAISGSGEIPEPIVSTLQDAVSDVLRDLGISAPLSIETIGDLGFRLLFGKATLQHVGRGLTYLLPIVEMGLIGDPTLFSATRHKGFSLANFSVCAFEEPEAHLHPKLQAKLAEWFVALAVAKRQVLVETHSDHLVRRLRSLIAQAVPASPMEDWLLYFVSIIEVEQEQGVSRVSVSHLQKNGDLETWPRDFMGQAQLMEQDIYVAALNKGVEESERYEGVAHAADDEPYERPD